MFWQCWKNIPDDPYELIFLLKWFDGQKRIGCEPCVLFPALGDTGFTDGIQRREKWGRCCMSLPKFQINVLETKTGCRVLKTL